MLSENLKTLRKAKGLSQEELAIKLNVVRQTVSKWEQGLSVPDAELLIDISRVFDTPVSVLLGESVTEPPAEGLQVISEKLEIINLQLAEAKETRRKHWHWFFLAFSGLLVLIGVFLFFSKSPYLYWDYSDPETAVVGTVFHAFEFAFVRLAPFCLIGAIVGSVLTRKKR